MSRRYYFLLSLLPPLPEFGGRPGVTPAELHDCARADGPAGLAVDAVLLEADLLARESVLAGETAEPEPVVLSQEQLRGERPLPEYLAADAEGRRIPTDAVWEAYYRHVLRAAGRCGSRFLGAWVGFEVALRNAVAVQRARSLGLEPAEYVLAEDLADPDAPVEDVVTAWSAAPDPLKALRALDEARLAWTQQRSRYFSFSLDEVAAYARSLLLAVRWERLANEDNRPESGQAA